MLSRILTRWYVPRAQYEREVSALKEENAGLLRAIETAMRMSKETVEHSNAQGDLMKALAEALRGKTDGRLLN